MPACTFFGHRECYDLDREKLREAIELLIYKGIDEFFVGNQGGFDAMVHTCLKQLSVKYPHIRYCVVLAYLPGQRREYEDLSDAIYPEGLEIGLPKFAVERRNRWMIERADCCLCYINHTWGGAYKFGKAAKHRGLAVINMGNVRI